MLRRTSLMKRSAMLLLVFGVLLGAARAQTQSVLHNFCARAGCADGEFPYAGLVFDQEGNLYGTTEQGGGQSHGYGTGVVFKVNPSGKETVLYTFCAQTGCADGEWPLGGLVFDQKGDLYGTTYYGGAYQEGAVFKVTPKGKESVLYSFCPQGGFGCTDGENPSAGVVLDQKGNLYGTTLKGGAAYNSDCDFGCGAVFKVSPEGNETVLYSFCAQANCADGAQPYAGVVFDQKGNLYGTAYSGGNNKNRVCHPAGCGVVFKLTPEGKETVLYRFCAKKNCTDGANPESGLVFDEEGNLYGTAVAGGLTNQTYCLGTCGVVFKLTPEGKETVLHRFCAQSKCVDGLEPAAGLVFDQKGNLYGTTAYGGAYNNRLCDPYIAGCGVVFKLTPKGKETVLYSFCAQNDCADGSFPIAGLVLDKKGNVYGTTRDDGTHSGGVVFKITP
jgi:uncharacterized repeat protein (TIGR03803 family)